MTFLILVIINLLLRPVSFEWVHREEQIPIQSASFLSPAEANLAEAVYQLSFSGAPATYRLLYLGNSQAYTLLNPGSQDLIAPQWLQILLARQEAQIEIRLVVLPDLAMSEFLIEILAAGESDLPVEAVIGGLSLRRVTRENAIRPQVLALLDAPTVGDRLDELVRSNPDLPLAAAVLSGVELSDSTASQTLWRPAWEAAFDRWLSDLFPLVEKHADLREALGLDLILARNRLFGVTSASSRRLSAASYRTNLELLELSMRYARSRGIRVILTLAPVRPQQPNPIQPEDIQRFQHDLSPLVERNGALFFDYTALLSEEYWGNLPANDLSGFGGQPDFYHFNGEGHYRLAEQLLQDAGPWLRDWAAEKENKP